MCLGCTPGVGQQSSLSTLHIHLTGMGQELHSANTLLMKLNPTAQPAAHVLCGAIRLCVAAGSQARHGICVQQLLLGSQSLLPERENA